MGKDNKEIMKLITIYKDTAKEGRGLINKVRLYFVRRKIDKLISKLAQAQANLIYKQTVNFYKDIVNSNLK
jgi:hypothetical protein